MDKKKNMLRVSITLNVILLIFLTNVKEASDKNIENQFAHIECVVNDTNQELKKCIELLENDKEKTDETFGKIASILNNESMEILSAHIGISRVRNCNSRLNVNLFPYFKFLTELEKKAQNQEMFSEIDLKKMELISEIEIKFYFDDFYKFRSIFVSIPESYYLEDYKKIEEICDKSRIE